MALYTSAELNALKRAQLLLITGLKNIKTTSSFRKADLVSLLVGKTKVAPELVVVKPKRRTVKKSVERTRAYEKRTNTGKITKRSRTPTKRSRTPTKRSRTPTKRSRTPTKRSRTPTKRSRSPTKRSRTPTKRSRTSTKRSRTLTKRSRTPTKRSRCPTKRSRSPMKRSRSPTKRSRSPTKRSRSPTKRSRSPTKRSRTPTKRSRTPTKRSPSPTKRSRSPTKRSRSLTKRSRSPTKKAVSSKRDEDPCDVSPDCPKGYKRADLVEKATRCGVSVKANGKVKNMKELCRDLNLAHGNLDVQVEEVLEEVNEDKPDCEVWGSASTYDKGELINIAVKGCGYPLETVKGMTKEAIYTLIRSGEYEEPSCGLSKDCSRYGRAELLDIAKVCGIDVDDDMENEELCNIIKVYMNEQRAEEIAKDDENATKEGLADYIESVSLSGTKESNISAVKTCEKVLEEPYNHDYISSNEVSMLARDLQTPVPYYLSQAKACRKIYDKLVGLSYSPRELLYGSGVSTTMPGKYRKKYCKNADEPVDMVPVEDIPEDKFIRLSSGGCYNVDNVVNFMISNNLANRDMVGVYERKSIPAWANSNELGSVLSHRGLDPDIYQQYMLKKTEIEVTNRKTVNSFFSKNIDLLNTIGITGFLALSDNPSSHEGRDELFKMAQKALADLYSKISKIDPSTRDAIKGSVMLNNGTQTFGDVLAESGSTCIHGTGFKLLDVYLSIYTSLTNKPELLEIFLADKENYLTFHVDSTKDERDNQHVALVVFTPSTGSYGRQGYVDSRGRLIGVYSPDVSQVMRANNITPEEFYQRSMEMSERLFEEIEEVARS